MIEVLLSNPLESYDGLILLLVIIFLFRFIDAPKAQDQTILRKESFDIKDGPKKSSFPFTLSVSRENKSTETTLKSNTSQLSSTVATTYGAFVLFKQFEDEKVQCKLIKLN